MPFNKKFTVLFVLLLLFSTVFTGCVISPSAETALSSGTDSTETAGDSAGDPVTGSQTETGTEPSADTTASAGTSSTAVSSANPATTKPATTKPATTKPPTTTQASTSPPPASGLVLDNLLGQSVSYITQQFGSPVATERSEYGFTWYVYHRNYSNFFMIGIQNSKVVGLYSNSAGLSFAGIKSGAAKSSVRAAMGGYTGPMQTIKKTNYGTEYGFQPTIINQRDVFTDNQKYVTMFYDNTRGGILTAVQIIDYATIQSFDEYPPLNTKYTEDYEQISFYLINSIRKRFGKSILNYDIKMASVADGHSQDMITNSYFNHLDSFGKNVGDRIMAAGYNFSYCAENISMNHQDSISAHEDYMNSSGHRDNILDNKDRKFTSVGIGIRFTSSEIRQTIVFIKYP